MRTCTLSSAESPRGRGITRWRGPTTGTCSNSIRRTRRLRGFWRDAIDDCPLSPSRGTRDRSPVLPADIDLLPARLDSVHLPAGGEGRTPAGPQPVREVASAGLLGGARSDRGNADARPASSRTTVDCGGVPRHTCGGWRVAAV